MPTVYRRESRWYAKVKLPEGHRDHKPDKSPWRNYPTGQTTRQRALVVAEEMQARVDRGLPAVDESGAQPAVLMTVQQLSERFLAEYHRRRLKDLDAWRQHTRRDLRAHVWPSLGSRPAATLTRAEVQAWLLELRRTKAARTCNLALDRLSGMYTWALDLDLLECKHPCRRVERFAPPQEEARHLTLQQGAQILKGGAVLASAGELGPLLLQAWVMVSVALYQGLRWAEIRGMRRGFVDLRASTLDVREQLGGGAPKSGRARLLPLHPRLVPIIAQHLRTTAGGAEDPMFPRTGGGWITRGHGTHDPERLRELLERVGVPPAAAGPKPWHCLRHTFATALHQATGNDLVVARLLGHSFGAARGAPRVTGTYIHNDMDHLRAELARLQYLEP